MVKNRQQIKKMIGTILTVTLSILIVCFLYRNKEIFLSLRNLKYSDVFIIALLQPINMGIIALMNKLIVDHIHRQISFGDSFMLQYVNNFLNKIVAEGGSVYRAGYLKYQYSFPLSQYISSLGGVYIIGLMANSIIGVLSLIIIFFTENVFNPYILIVFLTVIAGCFLLIVIEPRLNENYWLFKKINQVLGGWNNIKSSKRLLSYIFFLSVLGTLISAISTFVAYRGLDASIKFVNSILYGSILTTVNFVNLTPGGLGVNEAVLVFSSEVIGISSEAVLLGALLMRAITLITSFVLGGASYLILNYRLVKTQKD